MKKQINQLIALAEQYARAGKEMELRFSHNYLRAPHKVFGESGVYNTIVEDKPKIRIYFSDSEENYKSWSLDYGEIEVTGFTEKIILPFDITVKQLKEAVTDLEEFLPSLNNLKGRAEEKAKEIKLAEIDRLEAQISKLKESV